MPRRLSVFLRLSPDLASLYNVHHGPCERCGATRRATRGKHGNRSARECRAHRTSYHVRGAVFPQVLEHHRSGQDLRCWIGLVRPGEPRRTAMHRLEVSVTVTDIGGGAHAETTQRRRSHVAEDVADKILHYHDIELFRPPDQIRAGPAGGPTVPFHPRAVARHPIDDA